MRRSPAVAVDIVIIVLFVVVVDLFMVDLLAADIRSHARDPSGCLGVFFALWLVEAFAMPVQKREGILLPDIAEFVRLDRTKPD